MNEMVRDTKQAGENNSKQMEKKLKMNCIKDIWRTDFLKNI